jgi:hypothetical protein
MNAFPEYRRTTEMIAPICDAPVEIAKYQFTFERWSGLPIADYYQKPVLDFDGKPLFAELGILQLPLEKDFEGVWVDTYLNRFRRPFLRRSSFLRIEERAHCGLLPRSSPYVLHGFIMLCNCDYGYLASGEC